MVKRIKKEVKVEGWELGWDKLWFETFAESKGNGNYVCLNDDKFKDFIRNLLKANTSRIVGEIEEKAKSHYWEGEAKRHLNDILKAIRGVKK